MIEFTSSLIVYFRFLSRKKGLLISLFLLWLFSLIPYLNHIQTKDAVGLIHRSQYSQMASMFFFLMLGLLIGQKEDSDDCAGIVQSCIRSPLIITLAKITFLWLISFLFTIAMIISTSLAFALMQMPLVVHIYGIRMLLAYFLIPTMTCGIIGLIVGVQCHSRFKYVVLFTIWLLVSPISTEATTYLYGLFGSYRPTLRFLLSLLNLGGRITWGNTPAYGIPFEPFIVLVGLIKVLILFLYVISISCFSFVKKRRSSVFINAIWIVFAFSLVNAIQSPDLERTLLYAAAPELTTSLYDLEYHRSYYEQNFLIDEDRLKYPGDDLIKAKKYTVRLDIGLYRFKVDCSIDATILANNSIGQAFTLYHDLTVEQVKCNELPIDFQQNPDYFTVRLPNTLKPGDAAVLQITYSGTSSPVYQATAGAVHLPGSFPWLPEVGLRTPLYHTPVSGTAGFILNSTENQEIPIEYELYYQPNSPIYTNLESAGNGRWYGTSTDGVTLLVNPLLKTKQLDGRTLYYSSALQHQIAELADIALASELQHRLLMKWLEADGIDRQMDQVAENIVVFPVAPTPEQFIDIFIYPSPSQLFIYLQSPYKVQGLLHFKNSPTSSATHAFAAFESDPAIVKACVEEPVNRLFLPLINRWLVKNSTGTVQSTRIAIQHDLEHLQDLLWEPDASGHIKYPTAEERRAIMVVANLCEPGNEISADLLHNIIVNWYQCIRNYQSLSPQEILYLLEGVYEYG